MSTAGDVALGDVWAPHCSGVGPPPVSDASQRVSVGVLGSDARLRSGRLRASTCKCSSEELVAEWRSMGPMLSLVSRKVDGPCDGGATEPSVRGVDVPEASVVAAFPPGRTAVDRKWLLARHHTHDTYASSAAQQWSPRGLRHTRSLRPSKFQRTPTISQSSPLTFFALFDPERVERV